MFSANARTVASKEKTDTGKRVVVIDPANQPDLFAREVIARAKAFLEQGPAATRPPRRSKKSSDQ